MDNNEAQTQCLWGITKFEYSTWEAPMGVLVCFQYLLLVSFLGIKSFFPKLRQPTNIATVTYIATNPGPFPMTFSSGSIGACSSFSATAFKISRASGSLTSTSVLGALEDKPKHCKNHFPKRQIKQPKDVRTCWDKHTKTIHACMTSQVFYLRVASPRCHWQHGSSRHDSRSLQNMSNGFPWRHRKCNMGRTVVNHQCFLSFAKSMSAACSCTK